MKRHLLLAAACAMALHGAAFAANSVYLTDPMPAALQMQKVSLATSSRDYKLDAARHVYEAYSPRIFKGRLPPLIHAVVVVETTLDPFGNAREVKVVRGPSHAPDVTAAVVEMIHRVSPFPPPSQVAGELKFIEIWLVTKDGRFQLDTLTEGQN